MYCKNGRNAAVLRALPKLTEYIQKHTANPAPCVLCQCTMSLHLNVVFFLCALMGNAACIIFIMWNSISGLDTWYHFRFNISCGVAVMVRSHQEKFQVIF